MSNLLSRVEESVRAKKLFREGESVLIAVSGGLDSMVLLHLLARLTPAHHWRLAVAHFNHQLRGRSSHADQHLVEQTAKKLGLPFVAGRADVRAFASRRGESIEMAARELRHKFLAKTALRRKIRVIALAHHADDQVELFFLRLLRGAGVEGLAGMKWRNPSPANSRITLARPLLA
ncbi:MAG TPA: tRNA lysidine(34) synthetase TilS, partial [Verrucomicrobiae bacterium]|nr:tRNA lysidine(34) synthetase TilS [Verrucomicrobiae bacterium]